MTKSTGKRRDGEDERKLRREGKGGKSREERENGTGEWMGVRCVVSAKPREAQASGYRSIRGGMVSMDVIGEDRPGNGIGLVMGVIYFGRILFFFISEFCVTTRFCRYSVEVSTEGADSEISST